MKIGDKVQLKPSYAKWYLNHPDIYVNGYDEVDRFYEKETLMHLMCCLGEPIYGVVTKNGSMRCYGVKWKIGNLSAFYFVTKRNVEVVCK